MKYKNLRYIFFGHSQVINAKCCVCGRKLDEGYILQPISDEAFELFVKKFGDTESDWLVGECCFGGYCGASRCWTPDDWYEENIKKFERNVSENKKPV